MLYALKNQCARRKKTSAPARAARTKKKRYCALLSLDVRCVLPEALERARESFSNNLRAMGRVIERRAQVARVRAEKSEAEYLATLARQAQRKQESLQWR